MIIRIVSFLLVLSLSSQAQQLTLQECIKLALENNLDVKNSELDLESTQHRIKEANSGLLPTIDLNGSYQYYFEVPAMIIPASTFGGPAGEYSAATLSVPQTTSANVQLSQTLYNHQVLIGLKAAKSARNASMIQFSKTKEDITYNVSATYYNIQVLRENLGLIESNITNLEKTVKTNEVLKNNDIVSGSTYKRLLINLENLKNEHENQKLSLDKNLNLLNYIINHTPGHTIDVVPFDYTTTLTGAVAGDVNHRLDVQLQKENIQLALLDKKSIIAGYYPSLNANLFYGYTGYNDKVAPFDAINNKWINSSYVSLSLKIPVFDGFSRQNKIRQKEVAVKKNINSLEQTRLKGEKEIQDAIIQYTSNQNSLVNTRRSLTLAEELFTNANIEYTNGILSITDLLSAQDDLSNARNNFSTSLINLKLAELELQKANGELNNNH